jgi:CRP-like cAMP-binding protein
VNHRPLLVRPLIHLGTLDPFRALSTQQLGAIAMETEEVVFEADTWLFTKGEPVRAMCMILDGLVERVHTRGTTTVGAGGLVGFPEVLATGLATHGVRARGDVIALRLATDELRDLCEHNYAILASLLTHVAASVSSDLGALTRVVAGSRTEFPPLPSGVLDRVGRMVALHRAPAFPSGSMDALSELAGHLRQVSLEPGEVLWEPGDPADQFALVSRGSLELSREGAPDIRVTQGGVPGLAETLADGRYAHRARTLDGATVLAVDSDPFMDVVEDHFEMGFSLLGWLARQLTTG